ncbi:MAG TPA: hypothetical protein VGM88_33715 [Kofleriaceae bacterium]|jgi:hypothetical protein
MTTAAAAARVALASQQASLLARPDVVGVGIGKSASGAFTIAVFTRQTTTDLLRSRIYELDSSDRAPILHEPALPTRIQTPHDDVSVERVPFGTVLRVPARGRAIANDFDLLEESSVQVGAGIGQFSPATLGTLGALAYANADGALVGITAQHVVDGGNVPMYSRANLDDPSPQRIGEIDRGTRAGVDAARVRFDPGIDPDGVVPAIGTITGWTDVSAADIGNGVALFGAMSGRCDGTLAYVNVEIKGDTEIPSLHDCVLARIDSAEGDSGSALLDSQRRVVGFLVGIPAQIDLQLRIFSPVGAVLERLDCNIPTGG